MADRALFIGWGESVRGRERKSLEVFDESVQYWQRLQDEGRIESFEVALLAPHGGDLGGFALLRGSAEQLDAAQSDDDFARMIARAEMIVERLGVVRATLAEGLPTQLGHFQRAIDELG